jgi:hypothetical protein
MLLPFWSFQAAEEQAKMKEAFETFHVQVMKACPGV